MDHPLIDQYRIINLDCRDLTCPDPLVEVLEAVSQMKQKEAVLMKNRIIPVHLFPKLEERGLSHHLEKDTEGSFELLIWQALDEN